MNFYNWAMENGYSDKLTIDRIDVNGDYSPLNCRWSTIKEQARNKRNTIYINTNNEKYVLLNYLEEKGKVDEYDKLRTRISRGWSLEDAFDIPYNLKRHYYYFGQFLISEFDNAEVGFSISKSDFIKKYGEELPHHKVACYLNNAYIKDLMEKHNIKNTKFKFIKMEELYENRERKSV